MPKMKLTDLHVTPLLQVRDGGLSSDAVADYVAGARRGDAFPPLVAFKVTDRKFPKPALVAGFHRHEAFTQAGLTECEVELREGTFAEAWLAAWTSNLKNAVRYTNADKRKAVESALKLFRAESAPVIADRISVSDEYVRKVRKELVAAGVLDPEEKVKARDGSLTPAKHKRKTELIPTVGINSVEDKNQQQEPGTPNGAEAAQHLDDETPGPVELGPPQELIDPVREESVAEDGPQADRGAPEPAPEPATVSFEEWKATLPTLEEIERQKGLKPGNNQDPDHPFVKSLKAMTALVKAINEDMQNDETGFLKENLSLFARMNAPLRMVLHRPDSWKDGKQSPACAKFVGLVLLRAVVRDTGKRLKKMTPKQIKRLIADINGASESDLMDKEDAA